MKVHPKKLTKKQTIETLDTLYTAAGSLRGRNAMKSFLRDLLTSGERIMLGRRILIARRILKGKGYDAIKAELKVGVTTISKVHRWLEDQMPGYEKAIKGMEDEFKARGKRFEQNKGFARLKRNYPLHFLLFPWPKGFNPKQKPAKDRS
ncbi:MAG: Trp family transcriptional regulator [Candidatus Paceibacterota bacterium]